MAFDIASFKSNLRNGGARPNLFEVEKKSEDGPYVAMPFGVNAAYHLGHI